MAIACGAWARFTEALEAHLRALRLNEEILGRENRALAYSLTRIGLTHLAAGRGQQAIESLERALKLRLASRGERRELALTAFALARALFSARRAPDRARALARQARAIARGYGPGQAVQVAEIDHWLAIRRP